MLLLLQLALTCDDPLYMTKPPAVLWKLLTSAIASCSVCAERGWVGR